ncbi:MAG: hypothetical protein ACLGJB_02755 [Blastocatellia bacterium]
MEPDIKTFSRTLIGLTIEANNDLMKCDALQAYLDENAHLLERTHHSLEHGISRSICNNMGGAGKRDDLKGLGSPMIVHREYKNVLAGFIGEDEPSMMIRLLAQRAAVCWLRVQEAEMDHTRLHERTSMPYREMEWAEKQLTMSQNRFLKACDALAKMRAMEAMTEAIKEKQGSRAKPRLALAQAKGA